jgi:hypothetical protein
VRSGPFVVCSAPASLVGSMAPATITDAHVVVASLHPTIISAPRRCPSRKWTRAGAVTRTHLSMATTCAWIFPSTSLFPNRRAMASDARSVASPIRAASRASISFLSGVPWQ